MNINDKIQETIAARDYWLDYAKEYPKAKNRDTELIRYEEKLKFLIELKNKRKRRKNKYDHIRIN